MSDLIMNLHKRRKDTETTHMQVFKASNVVDIHDKFYLFKNLNVLWCDLLRENTVLVKH